MPGVRRIEVNSDELVMNAVSSGGAAAYTSENAAIPVSEMTFSQSVLLKPTPLTALIPVSNVVLRNALANPDLDGLLRSDLVEIMSLRADLSMLRGAGVPPEPLGLTNMVGTESGLDLGANGGYLSLPQVRAIASIPRSVNAKYSSPEWVFAPLFLSHLEGLTDADGRFLADSGILTYDDAGSGGRLFGWPFRTTSQLPVNEVKGSSSDTTKVVFTSDLSDVVIGQNPGLEIATSGEASYTTDGGTTWTSASQNDQQLYRAVHRHDIGARRPQTIVVQRGVRV